MQMKIFCLVFLLVLAGIADVNACRDDRVDLFFTRSVRFLVKSAPCVSEKMVRVEAYAIRGENKFWLADSIGLSGPKIRLIIPKEIGKNSNVDRVVRYLRNPADFSGSTFKAEFYGDFSCGNNERSFLVRRIENIKTSRIRSPN